MWVRSLAPLSGLSIQCCRELQYRSQMQLWSNLALLWLWHRPAAAALIRPLAWEPPYLAGTALKSQKKKKKKSKIFLKERESSEWGLGKMHVPYIAFFLACTHIMWMFLGQGLNLHHSRFLGNSSLHCLNGWTAGSGHYRLGGIKWGGFLIGHCGLESCPLLPRPKCLNLSLCSAWAEVCPPLPLSSCIEASTPFA